MPKRSGRKSVSQTPAPKSDIVYGSKSNPKGSASSENSAKNIKLSEKTEKALKNKLSEFKEEHPNKKSVTLSDLKAVYRRGSGAYSKSHRPTITGGAPNSRAAWSYARVNKFLKKAGGAKVKAAYVQDDDLFAKGGELPGLVAPNGKPSNLTPEQYKLVRTPQFKAWFGDWENDAQNASKIVDENGEPLAVYHGAEIFNKAELGRFNIFKRGSYFTDTYKSAKYYAFKLAYGITDVKESDTEIYNVFLNIRNPKTFDYEKDEAEDYFWDFDQNDKRIDKYISEGYDGILWEHKSKMYDTSIKELEKHFINFSPNQIKLADGTNTTFDIDNQDIRYENGGLVAPNGKPSNLTPEQYKLVRTPQFKAWFGDSKVLDENEEPLVVYRGNQKKQEDLGYEFSKGKKNILHKSLNNEFGFFFTEDINVAKKYMDVDVWDEIKGGSLTIVFLRANRILDLRDFGIRVGRQIFLDGLLAKGIKFDGFEYLENQIVNSEVYEDWGYFIYEYFDVFPELKDLFISNGYDGVLFLEESRSILEYNVFVVFESNQIKLADGTNTTFDIDNQDIRYEYGGSINQEVKCVNCGWKWETADSNKEDMYICHQCGFDNTLYYTDIMSKLKKPMSVSEISQEHGVSTEYIDNQLDVGIKHELEHTDDEGIARIIALHHIGEKPNYYELVEKYKLEDGGQPSKFWHQADQYEIADFIQNERMATEELLCSGDTRIAKAIICRAKIDIAEQKEQRAHNLEEKNAWSAVKNIWEECLKDIKKGVVYEYKDGGECGCMSYKDGGLAYGNSHDKGGMPLKVESTGQNIEIEGGEGVINKRSMQMSKKLDFQGKKMTPCQIVSKINEMGGGVKFKCQDVAEILAEDGNF